MPKKHYTIHVTITEVTPPWEEKGPYNNSPTTLHKRDATELLSFTARADDMPSAIQKAKAHITAEHPEVRIEEIHEAGNPQPIRRIPIRDNPQA